MEAFKADIAFFVTTDMIADQRMQRIGLSLAKAGYTILFFYRELNRGTESLYLHANIQFISVKIEAQQGVGMYASYNWSLFQKAMKYQFRAVCAIDADTLIAGYFVTKAKACHFFFDAHEYFSQVPELSKKPFKKFIWQLVENIFIPKVEAAYTVSSSLQEIFSRKYKLNFQLIRNLPLRFDSKERVVFKELANLPERYFIYAGAVNAGRGIELVLETADASPLPIVICGDGDVAYKITNALKQKPDLQTKLMYLGFQEPLKLWVLITKAYAGILLLDASSSASYYYSLANKFSDYAAANIPQVFPQLPEYMKLNNVFNLGIPCDYNADDLLNALNALANNHLLYAQLQQGAKIASEVLNWEQEEAELINFYHHHLGLSVK